MIYSFANRSYKTELDTLLTYDLKVSNEYDFDDFTIINYNKYYNENLLVWMDTNEFSSWNSKVLKSLVGDFKFNVDRFNLRGKTEYDFSGLYIPFRYQGLNSHDNYNITNDFGFTFDFWVKIYDDNCTLLTIYKEFVKTKYTHEEIVENPLLNKDSSISFKIVDGKIGVVLAKYKDGSEVSFTDDCCEIIGDTSGFSDHDIFLGNKRSKWINITFKFLNINPDSNKGLMTCFVNARPIVEFTLLNPKITNISERYSLYSEILKTEMIGSLSQFKVYNSPLDASKIIHNFRLNSSRYRRLETFGGDKLIIDKPF